MGGKEADFLPFTYNKFGKMHFASKLIYVSVDIHQFQNPPHPLKIRVTGSFRENFHLKHRCSLKGSLLSLDLRSHQNRWLVVLRLNVPVNNFSVMSGRSHRFLGN